MKSRWSTDLERGVGLWGCLVLKTPLCTPLLYFVRVLFEAGKLVHKTPVWETVEIVVF